MYAHQLFSGCDYGADGYVGAEPFGADVLRDFRNAAIHAVTDAHHQRPSPVYGYVRLGPRQKVLLFGSVDQARGWYDQREHFEPGHDYAAVFDAANLHAPVFEDVGVAVAGVAAASGDPSIGHWFLPLALGLPAGALGGYYYRKWQEAHPGKIIPFISGDAAVGAAPWHSIEDVGGPQFLQRGPWVDIVGATADTDFARRRAWPRTRALIQSATREVLDRDRTTEPHLETAYPVDPYGQALTAYVWSLDAYGVTHAVPFASYGEALAHYRDLAQGELAALAVFDKMSPHWPNPVGWHKSDNPVHEGAIAQQIARHTPHAAHVSGEAVGAWPWHEIVGASPWYTVVGADLDVLRRQAKAAAEEWMRVKKSEGKRHARVLGVLLLPGVREPRFMAFSSDDLAFDWFDRATSDPSRFVYAAYYDTEAPFAPVQLNESVGGGHYAP
jgi:hypothetical protein